MLRSLLYKGFTSLLLASAVAFGQSQNASLEGQVTDKSGAVIPHAKATITSAERQFSTSIETDADGRFAFPNLVPGLYDVTISATGFRTYVQHQLQLLANQAARIDASLDVGDATTQI